MIIRTKYDRLNVKVIRICFNLLQIIGHGNFAVVRLCYRKENRKEYAAKVIDKVSTL